MSKTQASLRIGCYIFFPSGGIGRYTHHLLSEMATIPDTDVEAACTTDFAWRGTDAYRTWPGLFRLSHPIPAVRKARFLAAQLISPLRFLKRARTTDLNALLFANVNHLSYPFWKGRLKALGIPFGISVHDVRRQKAILNRAWEERNLRQLYRDADALFVHSEYQKNELVSFADVAADRVHIVPHGVYPHGEVELSKGKARKALSLPEEGEICLFFGQLRDEKNLDVFLEAFAASSSDALLVVAGKAGGGHKGGDYYRSIAARLGIERRVRFIERYIKDDETALLFTAADWTALPYKNSFTSQSGVLNTAVHYRCPVMVSSSPVLFETVTGRNIGVACDGDTVFALGRGIVEIGLLCSRHHEFAFGGYERAFSWDENARLTTTVLRRLNATV